MRRLDEIHFVSYTFPIRSHFRESVVPPEGGWAESELGNESSAKIHLVVPVVLFLHQADHPRILAEQESLLYMWPDRVRRACARQTNDLQAGFIARRDRSADVGYAKNHEENLTIRVR